MRRDANTVSAAGEGRLLILDGQRSHHTREFLLDAVEHNIIVLCRPAHTSHVLQPLDVGLFASLQHHYSSELDKWTSHGLTSVQRREFFEYPSLDIFNLLRVIIINPIILAPWYGLGSLLILYTQFNKHSNALVYGLSIPERPYCRNQKISLGTIRHQLHSFYPPPQRLPGS